MSEERKYSRRHFLSNAAMLLGAAELSMLGISNAQLVHENNSEGMNNKITESESFDKIKQIDAGVLNVGYAEVGPQNGTAVILLHGWPYDIHSYADAAELLAAKGYRVI